MHKQFRAVIFVLFIYCYNIYIYIFNFILIYILTILCDFVILFSIY